MKLLQPFVYAHSAPDSNNRNHISFSVQFNMLFSVFTFSLNCIVTTKLPFRSCVSPAVTIKLVTPAALLPRLQADVLVCSWSYKYLKECRHSSTLIYDFRTTTHLLPSCNIKNSMYDSLLLPISFKKLCNVTVLLK